MLVPFFSERIAVIEEALAGVNCYVLPADEVFWRVEFFLFKWHSWVVSKNWDLRKLHSGKIKRENILSIIHLSHLFYITGSITEEVFQSKVVHITFEGIINPHYVKAQHLSVVINILGQAIIRVSTTKGYLEILLVFFCVGWGDLHVF